MFISSSVNIIKDISRDSPYPKPELKKIANNKSAYDYLDEALSREGVHEVPANGLRTSWIEGNYTIKVRVHNGDPRYTAAKQIFRVQRQAFPVNNTGWEYLGTNGIWYRVSFLKTNDYAAMITHIPIP